MMWEMQYIGRMRATPIPSVLTLLDVTKKHRVGATSVSVEETVLDDTTPVTTKMLLVATSMFSKLNIAL